MFGDSQVIIGDEGLQEKQNFYSSVNFFLQWVQSLYFEKIKK